LGVAIALCESIDRILPNLAEVAPTVLLSVPRIFSRMYKSVTRQMEQKPAAIRSLYSAGLRAAKKRQSGKRLSLVELAVLNLADRAVFSRVRARFGNRLRFVICGGSAVSPEVAGLIDCLGIRFYEGYGLTEASPLVAVNHAGARRLGSVGRPIPGVRVAIDTTTGVGDNAGEVIVYGPNVMVGYHDDPRETRAAMTADGGLRTGDLGYLDADGFLFITGRIKEQYKLENGKYVAPGPIEEQIRLSPFVSNVFVYGDNRPFNVALVVPSFDVLRVWAAGEGIPTGSNARLCLDDRVLARIKVEVDKASARCKGFERIRRILLASEELTTESGMLTPSLKLKRRAIWQKYGPLIDALYASDLTNESGVPSAP
jgi:long-chain acyl-CoA synthetase